MKLPVYITESENDFDFSQFLQKRRARIIEMPGEESPMIAKEVSPVPPPLPTRSSHPRGLAVNGIPVRGYSCVSTATRDLWECLFNDGYRADVLIHTEDGGIICAHASILVIKLLLFACLYYGYVVISKFYLGIKIVLSLESAEHVKITR